MPKGRDIVDVVVAKPGRMSDIKICREVLNIFEPQQGFCGDKAYVGESRISTSSKKPKNGELTELQKEENKALSSELESYESGQVIDVLMSHSFGTKFNFEEILT